MTRLITPLRYISAYIAGPPYHYNYHYTEINCLFNCLFQKVRNGGNSQVRATVRIYMAPRLDENGERFPMTQQRKLFIEMDKFVEQCKKI